MRNIKFDEKIRGVNLGGWLVLEKWMTPSLFEGMKATDETTWCVELGTNAEAILKKHWDTWIVEDDFKWIADHGLNVVRIPVGYWIFGTKFGYPYHYTFQNCLYPFVNGGIDILDKAFDWAEKYNLNIVIDLHTAPGCQNGFDNGGLHGICEWTSNQEYIDFAVDTLERLARRYTGRKALYAIETLNEPRWDIPTDLLKRYNRDAYDAIRTWCSDDEVAVIYHNGFRKNREFDGLFLEDENVIIDAHHYQCFSQDMLDADISHHISNIVNNKKNEFAGDKAAGHRVCVGEWSLGLNIDVVSLWHDLTPNSPLDGLDDFNKDVAYKAYASSQLAVYEQGVGWFFWSYKVEPENAKEWNFRKSVELGWIPNNFS